MTDHPNIEIRPFRGNAKDYDAFALRCNASFRGGYRATLFWQLDYHLVFRFRRLECLIDGTKVAQVAYGRGQITVLPDGLMLLPPYQDLWAHIMSALLRYIGPGEFLYGSPWSWDPPRHTVLGECPEVTVREIQTFLVYKVSFDKWPSYEHYLAAMASNARRNAAMARKVYGDLHIDYKKGLSTIVHIGALMTLSSQLYRRKGIEFRWWKRASRFLLRLAAMGESSFTAVAYAHGKPAAAFGGICFGNHVYYMESGSIAENKGVSWHLIMEMMHRAHTRAPTGSFVIGFHEVGGPVSEGLEFFRRQCRAVSHETSIVRFSHGG